MFYVWLQIFWDVLKDCFFTFFILFLCYVLIEFLEEKILVKYTRSTAYRSNFVTILSAGFGLIPQCGFSVVATDLYAKGIIGLGSLMAIYISTSDEALPILLSSPGYIGYLVGILLLKFVYATLVGLILNFTTKKKYNYNLLPVREDKNGLNITGCCGHNLKGEHSKVRQFFIHPLVHSLKIFSYILVTSFIFHLIFYYVGEDAVTSFMLSSGIFQPILSGLVGLIPNCSISVIMTELFMAKGLSLGAYLSVLTVNSGLALITLFNLNRKNIGENLFIMFSLYFLGVFVGVITDLII